MREEENDMWVWGQGHMGRSGEGLGTVQAEAGNTACYVLNRVLVTKPQNKTPYELLIGRQPIISYLRPFRCHVTILNTIDQLGKFDGKSDSGFLVGYSLNSKDFRVYNLETKRVKENLHKIKLTNLQVQKKLTIVQEELEKLKRHEKEANDAARKDTTHENQDANTNSTNLLNAVSPPISTTGPSRAFNDGEPSYPDDPLMPHLEDIYASPSEGILTDSSYDDEGVVTDFNNLETTMNVSPTPTTRIHTIHPKTQILGDPMSAVQTRSKVNKNSEAHALIQKLWILVDLPFGKKAIGTKWVYRNKKDERGVIVRNTTRLVAQRHRQEEGIYYDEVFAPVARIEAIRIFLAFASYMGFIVYQMDVKSAFLYGTIDKEVYVTQPPGFVDPKFPNKVYKFVKTLYGLHQALKAWYATLSTFREKSEYRRGAIDKTLFIKQDKNDIMLVQVYVDDIIFGSTKKSWCDEFEDLMKNRFQMSSMGKLTF
nr:putative ribonuclease H-like domain-containing protein [Tanacetum cinerariifolium]